MRFSFLFFFLVWSAFAEVAPRIYQEDFGADPSARWSTHGDTNLFSWVPGGELAVTWDSSKTNSYFYLPLGLTLTRDDDFRVTFSLRLQEIQIGTDPLKPYTFQIAAGLINTTNAFAPEMYRGSGVNLIHGARNAVELDYFPDSGFGATVAPTLITQDNQIAYSHNYPLEFAPGVRYRIEMFYTATNKTLGTRITADGQPFGLPPDNAIKDLVLTDRFTNFFANAFAICSYNDSEQSPPQFSGSILAHGFIDDVEIAVYHRPTLEIAAGPNSMINIAFETESDWIYFIEASRDLSQWIPDLDTIMGTGQRIEHLIPNNFDYSFYRVTAERQ